MEMENKCLGRQLFLVIYQEEDEGGGGSGGGAFDEEGYDEGFPIDSFLLQAAKQVRTHSSGTHNLAQPFHGNRKGQKPLRTKIPKYESTQWDGCDMLT